MKRKGWTKEPARHSLAARGVRTSQTARMVESRKGYRCESAYGSGARTPSKVVEFEFFELDNLDEEIVTEMAGLLGLPEDSGPRDILRRLRERYDEDYLALWLATEETARDFYCEPGETPDEYEIPGDAMVLQDLGYDGALFMMKRPK